MDTVDGRFLLNTLATYYTIPYFDVGVRLDAVREGPRKGRIREVCGTISYLQPGRSSLMSRGLFTMRASGGGSFSGAMILLRMLSRSGTAILPACLTTAPLLSALTCSARRSLWTNFLPGFHPFHTEPNSSYATVIFSLASMELICEPEEGRCEILANKVGIGDAKPLLGLIELSERRTS